MTRIPLVSLWEGRDALAFATRLTSLPKGLIRSIELAGVLDPPLVLEGHVPRLVAGFRRVQALDELGADEVLCRSLPDTPSLRRQAYVQSLLANALTPDFSSVEGALGAVLLESLCEEPRLIETSILPLLGLGQGAEALCRCRAVAGLPRRLLAELAERKWPIEVAERYAWFSSEDALALFERFKELRLTASETRRLLEDWIRCASKRGVSPKDLLKEWQSLSKEELLDAMDASLRLPEGRVSSVWEQGTFQFSSPRGSSGLEEEDVQVKSRKGPFLKKCPGAKGALCCNYRVLNLLEGCPLSCDYCILREYLSSRQGVTLFSNWRDGLVEVEERLSLPGVECLRIGTGELGDSLAMEEEFPLAGELIEFFSKRPKGLLELKTKTDKVDTVLESPHAGNVVIGWSLNPQPLIDAFEGGSASLDARLEAARRCRDAGYQVAFHFDPMIRVPGWRDLYSDCCEELLDALGPSGVAWVSLGALRFTTPLWNSLLRRDPRSPLLQGEFVRQADGKVRYQDSARVELMGHVLKGLTKAWPDVPIYLCMEEARIWKALFGAVPGEVPSLDLLFRPGP